MKVGKKEPGNPNFTVFPKQYLTSILKYLFVNTLSSVYCRCIKREPRASMTRHNDTDNVKRSHSKTDPGQPVVYQIRIEGHLDHQWADWFSGMSVTLEENGDTLLTGPVADQAALFGLLKKIRDLGLPLISVNCVELVNRTDKE